MVTPRSQAGQDCFAFSVTGKAVGTFLDVGSGEPVLQQHLHARGVRMARAPG